MSTPNFALKNASRYFVIGTPVYYTQENIDEYELNQDLLGEYDEEGTELNFQASKENTACELKAKGWTDIHELEDDRNYPTSFFAAKRKTITIGNVDLDIIIKAGCTPGYYQAANFDWSACVQVWGLLDGWREEYEYQLDELEADDVIRDNWYNNKGLSKIHASHIINKIAIIIDELKNEAEFAFSKYCDEEMFCAYRCSNGEAGYSKTENRLWQEVEEHKEKTA